MQQTFRPKKDPRPEMEQALERAIEISQGEKEYHIIDGRLTYEQPRQYHYSFTLESSWDLPDGADIQLKSADFDHLLVELLGTKDESIMIMTTQRLPASTLSHATLSIERAYLLRKMKEALFQGQGTGDLGLKLFGHLDCADEIADSSSVDLLREVFIPDDAQRLAIQRALASDIQLILGPGGTGKTDVLAAIAMLHAILYKHRVLIASHTNIAIDNAVMRLASFFRKDGMEYFLDEQNLVRAGTPHLTELETEPYRHVTMSLIVSDAVEQQRGEIARLEDRREKLLHDIEDAQTALPRQIHAWEQRQKEIRRQQKRAQLALKRLEAEEQDRLAPLLAYLSLLEQRATSAIQSMKDAITAYRAAEARFVPLQQQYTDQWALYQAAQKKLAQVRAYPHGIRFFVQLFTGEWQKNLETSVKDLAVPLQSMQAQITPIQQQLAEAKQTYDVNLEIP